MHRVRFGTAFLVFLIAGCASGAGPVALRPDALALATQANSEQFIVLAVANDPDPQSAHPGSTGRSYSGSSDYVVSDSARRTMRNLTAQYHLQPVAAWPIGPLHLHCAVLQVPAGVTREAMLDRLRTDQRVALVEPLQDYAVQTSAPDPYAAVQTGNERMDITE